jgi:hypothetical protein
MSELIDKQAALELVRDKCLEILDRYDSHYDVDVEDYVYDDPAVFNTILTCNKEIRNALSEMPTIDAEPVIRCKDCKFFKYDVCECIAGMVHCGEDDFCSEAEPKEDA